MSRKLGGVAIIVCLFWSYPWLSKRTTDLDLGEGCAVAYSGIHICALSDMVKLPDHGPIPLEGTDYNLTSGEISLDAARNETVAFQVLLTTRAEQIEQLQIKTADFIGENGEVISSAHIIPYLAHYTTVENGGYTWGTKSQMLPWPDRYPDALIPFQASCGQYHQIISQFTLNKETEPRKNLWFDIYIPKSIGPGIYHGKITLLNQHAETYPINLKIKVWNVTLPDQTSFAAIGEIYHAYDAENAGLTMESPLWQKLAHCYQQLAHAHRMVFIERTDTELGRSAEDSSASIKNWQVYDKIYGPILQGTLFTRENDYLGPGEATPVAIWRTPWPQDINRKIEKPFSLNQIQHYQDLAQAWAEHVKVKGWDKTRYFAYVFDEVDGPTDEQDFAASLDYLTMAHQEMRRLQTHLDQGSDGEPLIDLIWTSHSDPQQWAGKHELDLQGTIRHWCPNAKAAHPKFLKQRVQQGERAWFYHAGHPYIGVHAINAHGIEMRTWGLATVKYGLQGHLMWAVNYGDPIDPYRYPSFKRADDRVGNGLLVYPGAKLNLLGYASQQIPIPSMRLKAWRRGLQDAELILLARASGHDAEVDNLLDIYLPRALGEARGAAAWPSDPLAWYHFSRKLLALASAKTSINSMNN